MSEFRTENTSNSVENDFIIDLRAIIIILRWCSYSGSPPPLLFWKYYNHLSKFTRRYSNFTLNAHTQGHCSNDCEQKLNEVRIKIRQIG